MVTLIKQRAVTTQLRPLCQHVQGAASVVEDSSLITAGR